LDERYYLYDETVDAKVRFVSFMGHNERFDLAIIQTDRYYGKYLVLNLLSDRFAIIGEDDLKEPGYLEHAFQLSDENAKELREFLYEIV
jgi:hypothetical protein